MRDLMRRIEEAGERLDFCGVVRVAADGQSADYARGGEGGDPFHAESRFLAAGMLGGVASCAALAAEGKRLLTLRDPLARWVPELSAFGSVTLSHLLAGKSGLPDYRAQVLNPRLLAEREAEGADFERYCVRLGEEGMRTYTGKEVADMIAGLAARGEPGKAPERSSSELPLLALAVERAAGMPFSRFCDEAFFAPLGMENTGWGGPGPQGYVRYENGPPLCVGQVRGEGPAGLISTAADLSRWASFLLSPERILGRAGAKRLYRLDRWGVNHALAKRGNGYLSGGTMGGCRAAVYLLPESGATVAVVSNRQYLQERRDRDITFESVLEKLANGRLAGGGLSLARVTPQNVWDVLEIELAEHQTTFVAPPAEALAAGLVMRRTHTPLALTKGGFVVGLAVLEADGKTGDYWISVFLVDKHFQGLGYGTAGIELCKKYLAERGGKRLRIAFNYRNETARHVYEKCGFVVDENFGRGVAMSCYV